MSEHVIIVNEEDQETGEEEKIAAHQQGLLHRAFSVFIFNADGRLLLQRRDSGKYHSGGLWSNTCCGHPRPGENTAEAAERRLHEEMGFTCALTRVHGFHYQVDLRNDLIENEYDHVFVGWHDESPVPDPDEVEDWAWVEPTILERWVQDDPDKFTYWFHLALPPVLDWIAQREQG